MFKKTLTIGLVVVLTFVIAGTALAAEAFMETGTVVSVGTDSFEMDVAGMTYTVLPPEGFDLTTLMAGDTVQVEGEVDTENIVTATSIGLVTGDGEEEEVKYMKDGYFCQNPDAAHPVVQKIADENGVPYEEVLAFFCGTDELGHNGLGGIMLAYKASATMGDGTTAADILKMKKEMGGWGKVWQYLGLVGNSKHAGTPGDGEGTTEAVIAGDTSPSNHGGKPDHAGKGKPDHTGPPDHANNKNKNKNP